MVDSSAISQVATATAQTWLLFIHQIPPKPDYFRVKVRRRLQRIGAVPLKNSVYVLPATEEATEDFQWLRRAVVDEGGEATLCTASFVEGLTDGEITLMFRAQSAAEYRAIREAARGGSRPTDAEVRRLKRQLQEAEGRDFFGAEGREAASRAVRDLEGTLRGDPAEPPSSGSDGGRPVAATWVTRRGVFVDRIASAWLIRRFIDPAARFTFVDAKGYRPRPGELRFDMYEGEYTHEGEDCTFEVLLTRFALDDASLRAIAEIVHDVDCKDDKFGREEASGVAAVLRGITVTHDDDDARLEAGSALFDGLYASLRPNA